MQTISFDGGSTRLACWPGRLAPAELRVTANQSVTTTHARYGPRERVPQRPMAGALPTPSVKFHVRASITAVLLGWILGLLVLSISHAGSTPATSSPAVILAVGAPGEAEYATNFLRQVELWSEAARRGGASLVTIGTDSTETTNDRPRLQQALESASRDGDAALWLVLIGHGTFDGKEARFNLRGPDVTATELAAWLSPFHRPLAIIDTTSASAPFLQKLSATNRIVITATRSGYEQNATRFGKYFAEALLDPVADLDGDGQVSLLEAFLSASQAVAESYRNDGRLLTEHALLDDTGDGLGTPAEWFSGLRATKRPKDKAALDSVRAHQLHLIPSAAEQQLPEETRARRDELERQVFTLREQKAAMPAAEYYSQLEAILLKLARLYAENPGDQR